jgi:hypothetical protein
VASHDVVSRFEELETALVSHYTYDRERDEARYAKARAGFSVTYMSNAKWYKMFKAIAIANLGLARMQWKFIDSDRLYDWGVPGVQDLLPDRLADGHFQPIEYR